MSETKWKINQIWDPRPFVHKNTYWNLWAECKHLNSHWIPTEFIYISCKRKVNIAKTGTGSHEYLGRWGTRVQRYKGTRVQGYKGTRVPIKDESLVTTVRNLCFLCSTVSLPSKLIFFVFFFKTNYLVNYLKAKFKENDRFYLLSSNF